MRPRAPLRPALAGLLLALVVATPAAAAAGPSVFWASSPLQPGETALLYGDGLETAADVRFVRLADGPAEEPGREPRPGDPARGVGAKPVQPSPASVKAVVPATLQPGVLAAWVRTRDGWTPPVFLNRPDPWWTQGDRGLTASPGGWLAVFGTSLAWPGRPDARPRLALVGDNGRRRVLVDLVESGPFRVTARVPPDVAEGRYRVWAHGGLGGQDAWAGGLVIRVERPEAWPTRVLSVADFGATGDGTRDDTAAIGKALEEAGRTGGVVYFPRGLYRITATLDVPPRTVLRGERQDLVDLFWPDTSAALPAVVRGRHSFALEDLTLHFVNAQHGIVATETGPEAGRVLIRRVRARWMLYSGNLKPEVVDQRFRESLRLSTGGGDLVRLTGRDVEVTDCDLSSAGRVLVLQGVEGAVIARNLLRNGRWGWYDLDGGERIVFERNTVAGGDLMSTGGAISTYRAPSSRFVYYAHNTLRDLYGWDREAMTTDAGGGEYVGPIASATATTVTYPTPPGWSAERLPGRAAFVIGGKGRGQVRRIAGSTDRSLTVEAPWDVVPDSTSVVGITAYRGNYLFVGNTATDASVTIQLFGVAFRSVVAQNKSVRAGGFRSYAAKYPSGGAPFPKDVQPQMLIQYLDNEIEEGSSYFRGANTGSVIQLQAVAPAEDWAHPMALGFVFRGNTLRSHARVRLTTAGRGTPLIEDVVIERNRILRSPVGIEIGERAARVWLRHNRFEEVAAPVVDRSGVAEGPAAGKGE
jgi:Pectate lyase superfamily protein